MMAGTGVSVGGAGMLRARRRDVSVKPNRKLDRKSSRGMIYENEELRLRTIHINAEVEQGQNDIKKLRKENEQLRREIWSLRDEYDKLEEILKRQKSREESEEYEIRSDEDDGPQSDYSLEEEEEEEEEEEVEDDVDEEFDEDKTTQVPGRDLNKAEQLENAENQKISSEKMTSSVHRLHVDFDDLSVVDEEEELKRDKDNKVSTEEGQLSKEEKSPSFPILKPRHLHENIPFYPAAYQPPDLSTPSYYAECPFKFPSTMNLMMTPGMQEMAATRLQTEPLLPGMTVSTLDQANDQMVHAPPAGWQTNLTVAQKQMTPFGTVDVGVPSAEAFGRDQHRFATFSTFAAPVVQRRHVAKQANCAYSATPFGDPTNPEAIAENGWSFDIGSSNPLGDQSPGDSRLKDGEEKPKHFFAPLPSKTKRQMPEDSSPTISHFGTGSSSCSAKTESTVVSKSHLMCQKGSADVYVNGAIACEDGVFRHKTEQRTFLSTDNLLIADDKSSSVNQLTKSMSCQDLSSESQPATISTEARPQIMTQSDNTLDNISDSKPYRSHISVTLKRLPRKQTVRPRTPEVPKLPAMDYRLFNNPFLRTFDPTSSYRDPENVTTPLSVQVNDDNPRFFRSQPAFQQRGQLGGTDAQHNRYRPVQAEQNRLLMPTNQLLNGKPVPPAPKHEIQVTSFEKPSPHTLIGPSTSYELSNLRRINPNPYLQSQNLYQNVPFMSRTGLYPQRGMMYYDSSALKVPVQTQTSIDGDSHHEDEQAYSHEESVPSTPSGQRRKRTVRKEKLPAKNNLSPLAQRRTLKKQISVASSEIPESPGKRQRSRRLSITTTTASEGQEDKHESRSSSSGQDSPKKDQTRRVSLYFNTKKRPSLASVKTTRSGSVDMLKEKDGMLNSERERTTSTSSSRDTPAKSRKASTSSGSVPWCACWGNGCI